MKYTIYVKKEIKREADLPKENDRYAVHSKGAGLNDLHDSTWMRLYKDSWLRDYDYYLQPIELDLPDDEEIYNQSELKFNTLSTKALWTGGAKWLKDKIKNQLE